MICLYSNNTYDNNDNNNSNNNIKYIGTCGRRAVGGSIRAREGVEFLLQYVQLLNKYYFRELQYLQL